MRKVPGRRERRGAFARACSLSQQPASWAALALGLASFGGARGRRAAWRGLVSYAASGVVANIIVKPCVRRSRPPEAGRGSRGRLGPKTGPVTSSFPSGHSATEVAFVLAAAQEMPSLLLPLLVATVAGKISIIRTRGHYLGDVVAGSVAGIAVSATLWRVWPPSGRWPDGQRAPRGPRQFFDRLHHYRFQSTWTVDRPPEAVYPVLKALDRYPAWWPEVKSVTPSAQMVPRLKVRALLPYSLRFTVVHAETAEPGVLGAEMDGDLRGTSTWTVTRSSGGSRLVFDEDVVVRKRSLRLLSSMAQFLFRPLFRLNHSLMMRHGQEGLRAYIGSQKAGPMRSGSCD